jgi:hypothetical protein
MKAHFKWSLIILLFVGGILAVFIPMVVMKKIPVPTQVSDFTKKMLVKKAPTPVQSVPQQSLPKILKDGPEKAPAPVAMSPVSSAPTVDTVTSSIEKIGKSASSLIGSFSALAALVLTIRELRAGQKKKRATRASKS